MIRISTRAGTTPLRRISGRDCKLLLLLIHPMFSSSLLVNHGCREVRNGSPTLPHCTIAKCHLLRGCGLLSVQFNNVFLRLLWVMRLKEILRLQFYLLCPKLAKVENKKNREINRKNRHLLRYSYVQINHLTCDWFRCCCGNVCALCCCTISPASPLDCR